MLKVMRHSFYTCVCVCAHMYECMSMHAFPVSTIHPIVSSLLQLPCNSRRGLSNKQTVEMFNPLTFCLILSDLHIKRNVSELSQKFRVSILHLLPYKLF